LSFDKYAARVKPGGICIVNSTLVAAADRTLPGVTLLLIPMNDIAIELGDARMVNMVACGAYAAASGALALPSLHAALKKTLPERNHSFIPANVKAIEAGAAQARAAQGR
jgi:2-oxoglutarate ferredoxin oxidoreductase subunit gamma